MTNHYFTQSGFYGHIFEMQPANYLSVDYKSLVDGTVYRETMAQAISLVKSSIVPYDYQPGMKFKMIPNPYNVPVGSILVLDKIRYSYVGGCYDIISKIEPITGDGNQKMFLGPMEYYRNELTQLHAESKPLSKSNGKCSCGAPAFVLFNTTECSNVNCKNYKA